MTTTRRIDDALSIREGHLFIEGCDTVDLAERFGTPLYVVSEDQLRRNIRRWQAAFSAAWPEGPVNLLPSIKANSCLALRQIASQEGAGCDTFGKAELYAALQGRVPPQKISVNGTAKDRELIHQAIDAGARITLDNPAELSVIQEEAARLGKTARIRFRLRPHIAALSMPSDFVEDETPISTVLFVYKPGIPFQQALELGKRALTLPNVDLVGLHLHIGNQSHRLEVWQEVVRTYVAMVAACRDAWGGWQPRELDLGGGFPPPRNPMGERLPRVREARAGVPPPGCAEYAEAIMATLREELARNDLRADGLTIEIEPGRAIYSDAGIHLTRVLGQKDETEPVAYRWIETDTSEIFLMDINVEHCRFPHVVASKAGAPPAQRADLVGLSCGFDQLVEQAELPEVEPGDIIAFLNTGAYEEALASNFNALPRPATLLVNGTAAEVIRRGETIQDVFSRDVIPPRLLV